MKNDKFKKGSGAYTCESCGKTTRETGLGESHVKLCAHCYEVGGWVNSVLDGDCEIDEVPAEFQFDVRKDLGM